MRGIIVFVIGLAMLAEVPAGAAGQVQPGGSLSGTATSSSGQTLANMTVQLRNLATGQLVGTTTSSATGAFSFTGLPPGRFAVEVVNQAGQVIGTSAAITVAAGTAVTGVTVGATAASLAAGAGAAAGMAAAGSGAGVSMAAIVTTVAATAGLVGAVAVGSDVSPSR
jgi:hypothetical protein